MNYFIISKMGRISTLFNIVLTEQQGTQFTQSYSLRRVIVEF